MNNLGRKATESIPVPMVNTEQDIEEELESEIVRSSERTPTEIIHDREAAKQRISRTSKILRFLAKSCVRC